VAVVLGTAELSHLLAQTPTPAPIENRVDALENKVDKMDSNISQILDLLKNKPPPASTGQQASNSSASATSATPASAPKGSPVTQIAKANTQSLKLQPGALLDVWLLEPDNDAIPTTPSMGTVLDEKAYFSLARYLDEPTLKGSEGQPLGFLWSGFLKIKEKGQHVFVIELVHGKGRSAANKFLYPDTINLAAELQIEGETVVSGKDSFLDRENQAASKPFSAIAELEPGLYKMQLWVTATAIPDHKGDNPGLIIHKNLSVALKLRAPSARTAMPLTSADIFHKE
jgi:hypothetical protein